MLHLQHSPPPRIAPARSMSSLASRKPVCSKPEPMNRVDIELRIPLHDELVIQRKEAMKSDLKGSSLSRAQVADLLTEASGVKVSERTIERWVDTTPDGLRRRMSAEMGVYWTAILGSSHTFDELLDEIKRVTVPEPHKIIAASYLAKVEAEQSLAQAMQRAS